MNEEQSEKFIDFLLPNRELKRREELKLLLKDETTEELKSCLPLDQDKEY